MATSGRSFWILDDINLLSQYDDKNNSSKIFTPEPKVYGSWSSQLDGKVSSFDGTSAFEGVNPANGIVMYYHLADKVKAEDLTLDIMDKNGNLIRSFSAVKDKNYKPYAGGPPPAPSLSNQEGLNRLVWDTRYPIMPGVENVYIEGSYRGHKVSPGTYSVILKAGDKQYTTEAIILDNPLYEVSKDQFSTYDAFMKDMENNMTEMHKLTNRMAEIKNRLNEVIEELDNKDLKQKGSDLVAKISDWDTKMVQRKTKAYDDVENFPNKFTAEYLFLINQTESSIPRVNESSKLRKEELDTQWEELKAQALKMIEEDIKNYNKELWKSGIGAIYP